MRQQVSRVTLCRKENEMIARWESYRAATRKHHRSYCCIRCETVMQASLQRKICKYTLRSRPSWFTDICVSQCLSHFATLFIDPWAETLNVKSEYRQRSLIRLCAKVYDSGNLQSHVRIVLGYSSSKRPGDIMSPITATTCKRCDA